MATANEQTNPYGTAYDGTVPGLTWAQFLQGFNPTNGGIVGSIGGSSGYIPGIGYVGGMFGTNGPQVQGEGQGFSSPAGLTYNDYQNYAQPTDANHQNVYTENPDGTVGSHNQTINDDSYLSKLIFDKILPTAIIGTVGAGLTGGALAGSGLLGEGAAAAAAPTTNGTLFGLGGGSSGSIAPLAGGSDLGGSAGLGANGFEYAGPQYTTEGGLTASAAPQTLTDGVVGGAAGADGAIALPGVAINATSAGVGADAGLTGGLTAGEVGAGAAGLAGIAGISTSLGGGGPSGTGISYSDAANSAANNTPYSGNANDGAPVSSDSSNSLLSSLTNGNGSSALGSLGKLLNGDSLGAGDYASLLGAGGSLLSGILGYKASNSAANSQVAAANNSNALAAAIYGNNVALQKPYVDGGTAAFNQQSSLNGLNGAAAQTAAKQQFTTDPGYQFALDQGNRAVQSSASAAGGLYSGRAAKDLTNYTEGVASQQYGNYYNRLQGQATLGQAAASQQAANGNNYVNNVTSNNASIGNAQAAGTVAGTNAITGSIGSILGQNSSNALLQQLLRNSGNSNGYYGG